MDDVKAEKGYVDRPINKNLFFFYSIYNILGRRLLKKHTSQYGTERPKIFSFGNLAILREIQKKRMHRPIQTIF